MIYLDNAATSVKDIKNDDIIINAMTNAIKYDWMNPSAPYSTKVKKKIDKCRKNIADFIGVKPNEIIFTSGASESNNTAIRGWFDEIWLKTLKTPHIVTTHIEHKSILKLLENGNLGGTVNYCEVDKYGLVNLESLKQRLILRKGEPILVSIHMANNEVGSLQDIKAISDLVHKYGGVLHVDATQALGKIPINVRELGIDLMSCSAHKISSVLRGIGFLYKKSSINIQPLIYGNQEFNLRGGTEFTYGIIGLSKALEYCDMNEEKRKELCNKRDYFIKCLEDKFGCKLNGHPTKRLSNNINVTFSQNITGESLLYALEMSKIYAGVGSACNSSEIQPSHVLKGIGLTDEETVKTVRFTLSDDIAYKDIDYAIDEIEKTIKIIENVTDNFI